MSSFLNCPLTEKEKIKYLMMTLSVFFIKGCCFVYFSIYVELDLYFGEKGEDS